MGSPVFPCSEEGKPCKLLVPSLLICGAGVCPLPLDPGQANGHMSCAKAVQLQPVARAQARIQKKSLEPKAEERPKD